MQISDLLFSLLRFELTDDKTDFQTETISKDDALKLLSLAQKHDIAHLVVDALRKNRLVSDEGALRKKMDEALYKVLSRDKSNNDMLCKAGDVFQRHGIKYIPLKGAVVRDLYPKRWMRSGCDVDILVHGSDLEKSLDALIAEGFESDRKKKFHDVDLSFGAAHLELHFNVCENTPMIDKVLCRVWEYSREKNGCEYAESNSFFAFHHLAHMSYHFIKGGCGIRPFIDLWLMRKKDYYDETEVMALCKECGLTEFFDHCRDLSDVWFEKKEHTALTEKMEQYILTGGVYGSLSNQAAAGAAKDKGRLRHMLKKIFPSFSFMKRRYPWLKKMPFLLPLGYLLRLTDKFFGKDRKKTGKKIASFNKSKSEDIKTVSDLLSGVGLLEQEDI